MSASPPTTASDPTSVRPPTRSRRGVVENLGRYAQRDLVVPAEGFVSAQEGNRAAVLWGLEVAGRSPRGRSPRNRDIGSVESRRATVRVRVGLDLQKTP